jgi:diguanylate cyclase
MAHLLFKDFEIPCVGSLPAKAVIGIGAGSLGIILMLYSVKVGPDIIIDFRYIPVMLTAIYSGWFPAIIASILVGGFRVLYFGVSEPSVIAMLTMLLAGIGFCLISNKRISRKKKWLYSMMYLLALTSSALIIVLKFSLLFFEITAMFCLANIVVAWVAFLYAEYLGEFIRLHHDLKYDAAKDFLTGLNNVRQFDASFRDVSQAALKNGKRLSLLFIDIDYFKNINDTYGHMAGDAILQGIAGILADSFRSSDIVSRNGGEEFTVLLMDCSSRHAVKIAEKLMKNVENHEFAVSEKTSLHITISVGVSTYPETTKSIGRLLEDADSALYEAKRNGRGTVVLYESAGFPEEMGC